MHDIVEVAIIFQRISETSSKNEKVEIIKNNSDNELFKSLLKFAFDDFVRTGISTKKINTINLPEPNMKFQDVYELMTYVKQNNTGQLQVVSNIKNFTSKFAEDTKDFLNDVFSKNIKVGITAKSINKALGKGFIREFGCQLAHPLTKYTDRVDGKRDFSLTQKLDGHRCIAIFDNGELIMSTRKGIEYIGLDALGEQAKLLATILNHGKPVVLDGELVLENIDNLATKDLYRATSRVLRNINADKTGILYNIFDWLPYEQFLKNKSVAAYGDRKKQLEQAFIKFTTAQNMIKTDFKVKIVPTLYSGSDISMIETLQNEKVDKLGWEGLMLNFNDSPYQVKRTPDLLKIKKFFSADVLATDVYEGTGEFEGALGGVIVQFKDFTTRVGSGFTQNERIIYWKHPEEIINKIIEIKYFEESQNQKDGKSLRFATFKGVRNDKTIEDINYES